MKNIITRIMEVEQKCAEEIRWAEQESAGKIEAHRQMLEEKKAGEISRILADADAKAAQAVEEAGKRIECESLAAGKEYEGQYRDTTIREEIKKKIRSILLAS